MKKVLFYILIFISAISFSQVTAEIDTSNIRIGEQFQYKISVDKTENVIIPKLVLKGLEIIDSTKIDTIKNSLIRKYILTGFDSGAYYIPQQQIFIKNQAYLTDSLLVNIATIPTDTSKVKKFPIKGIKSENYQFDDFKPYLWWLLAILTIIGLLVYYFVFREKKEEEEIIATPVLAPYEEAMQKLQQLDDKLLWQNNHVKKYYSELTDIVRNYIGRDIEIPTLELTSNEIIELITVQNDSKKLGVSRETIDNISKLLRNADLVKFAKSKPISNEIESDRKIAEQIINSVKPKIEKYKAILLSKNPGLAEQKTIDYKQSSSEFNNTSSTQKEKKWLGMTKDQQKKLMITIGFLVFFPLGSYLGKKTVSYISYSYHKYFDGISTEKLYTDETKWQTKSYGNPSVSFEAPVILEKEKSPEFSNEVKKVITEVHSYNYENIVNKLQIATVNIVYLPSIPLSLDGAVNGAVTEMKNQKGVSNMVHSSELISIDKVEGAKVYGTLTESGIDKQFTAYILVEKNYAWIIIFSHEQGDPFGEKIVERIVESIKIDITTDGE